VRHNRATNRSPPLFFTYTAGREKGGFETRPYPSNFFLANGARGEYSEPRSLRLNFEFKFFYVTYGPFVAKSLNRFAYKPPPLVRHSTCSSGFQIHFHDPVGAGLMNQ